VAARGKDAGRARANRPRAAPPTSGLLEAYALGLGEPIAISASMARASPICSRSSAPCRARDGRGGG